MPSDYLPSAEPGLNQWATNFNTKLQAGPVGGVYGLTPAQITEYNDVFTAWAAAYSAITDNTTRTPQALVIKNQAKAALIAISREFVRYIQGNPDTTDAERSALDITIRDTEPTPIDPPATYPVLTVESVYGRTVTLRIRDSAQPDQRAKPEGVAGALIMYYIGENEPLTVDQWILAGNTTKTSFTYEFSEAVVPSTKVWFIAQWFNPRQQTGLPGNPVNTHTEFGGFSQAA
ncbi:MAG: hypothetical protein ACR2GY_01245 [Phycisphaerales bacterium]